MNAPAIEPLLTIDEVCEALSICEATLHKLRRAGEIKSLKIGKSRRFRLQDVELFKEQQLAQTERLEKRKR